MARKKGKSTIALAQAHYAEKITVMGPNYVAGVNRFFGQNVSGSAPVRHYTEKIKAGADITYATNLKRAFGV
jgi:hypothetical protein